MIKYTVGNVTTNVSTTLFPAGEVKVDINIGNKCDTDVEWVYVDVRFSGSDTGMSNEIIALMMTTDALRRYYPLARFCLSIPYIPYGLLFVYRDENGVVRLEDSVTMEKYQSDENLLRVRFRDGKWFNLTTLGEIRAKVRG